MSGADTVVFAARRILTQDPSRPAATHVAVRSGRVLAVGSVDELRGWGPFRLDQRFADHVLMPGLVEAHSHLSAGGFWRHRYCGWFDAVDPDGRRWAGSPSLDHVVAALQQAAADRPGDGPVLGWGFDPIYFVQGTQGPLPHCTRADLDRVSRTRPVGLLHASGHILNVNTVALERAGFARAGLQHPGLPLADDGLPRGELRGPELMMPALAVLGLDRSALSQDEWALQAFGRLAVRTGVTTATDLMASLTDDDVAVQSRVSAAPDYPVRLVPLLRLVGMTPQQAVARCVALRTQGHERYHLGRLKVVADGSIQGFTARLLPPGYYNGAPNGLWYTAPEVMRETLERALRERVLVHVHANGDEAAQLVLDCLEQALQRSPAADHRTTLQHAQLVNAAQLRRMAALGAGVNLFANHHFYWGDQHRAITVGPERAERMNPCASALQAGVPLAIHSDAPVTPLGPLFTAWCAVNRLSASGRTMGAAERIGVADALRAITLGAARCLGLDDEIGSIACGKRADFCVLEDDPLAVDPAALKDLRVWGTVLGGVPFEAACA